MAIVCYTLDLCLWQFILLEIQPELTSTYFRVGCWTREPTKRTLRDTHAEQRKKNQFENVWVDTANMRAMAICFTGARPNVPRRRQKKMLHSFRSFINCAQCPCEMHVPAYLNRHHSTTLKRIQAILFCALAGSGRIYVYLISECTVTSAEHMSFDACQPPMRCDAICLASSTFHSHTQYRICILYIRNAAPKTSRANYIIFPPSFSIHHSQLKIDLQI